MTAQDAQKHIEDIKAEISWLLFHKQTLIRKMELLKPKIESQIVKPTRITNLSQLSQKDIEVDVIPANLASMEVIQDREGYYYAMVDLANTEAAILAKKEMLTSYVSHIKQELTKRSKPCTDEMIYEAFHKAHKIKDWTTEEETAFKNISENLLKTLNSGKEARIELYETLQNLLRQHGV